MKWLVAMLAVLVAVLSVLYLVRVRGRFRGPRVSIAAMERGTEE